MHLGKVVADDAFCYLMQLINYRRDLLDRKTHFRIFFFSFSLNLIIAYTFNMTNRTYMQLAAWHCANVPHQIHFLPHTNTCPRHFHDVNVSPASRKVANVDLCHIKYATFNNGN